MQTTILARTTIPCGGTTNYDGDDTQGNPVLNRWYQYSVNESGVYTLKPTRMTATLYDDVNNAGDGSMRRSSTPPT